MSELFEKGFRKDAEIAGGLVAGQVFPFVGDQGIGEDKRGSFQFDDPIRIAYPVAARHKRHLIKIDAPVGHGAMGFAQDVCEPEDIEMAHFLL